MNIAAPAPSLGFSVGIVGHRTDRIENWDAVRARIDEVLGKIQAALDTVADDPLFMAGRHKLRLVSALAEGTDRIAAQAALDLGQVLEVVLPFEPEEYEKDFAEDAVEDFRELLAQASAVITLDGRNTGRPMAYEASGYTMLDNCDLLIAVWDGQPGRGRGGTREMLDQAARRSMPVVLMPPDGSSVTVRGTIRAEAMRFDDVPDFPLARLADLIASIVGTSADASEDADWRSLADLPPNPIIHGAYPLLLKLAGVRPWFRRKGGAWHPKPPEGALEEAFAWWDHAAIQAAQAFRSAVIVNFALASLAVVLAASSLLAGSAKWLFVVAELLTIILLLTNAWQAGRMRWQERWLESRQVAELLRVGILLRHVGIGRGISDPGGGGSNGWYAGAIARSCPIEAINLAEPRQASAAVVEEVRGQADWNESTAHRMHLASHRIERFGEVLFVAVVAAALGWLVIYFLSHETGDGLKYALTTITAGLPAIATASYGIRIILDFEGVANRAHKIAHGLGALLDQWEKGPHTTVTLQDFARQAADIMIGDVAAWRLLAEGRRLTIPG
jgi:hypothetical protein